MTSPIRDQIAIIQQRIKSQAERLGQFNMKNNDYLQQNQKLARQIVDLRAKVLKKKHIIEQQNKDKMIIHEKLIKAERQKQLLQIQQSTKNKGKRYDQQTQIQTSQKVQPVYKNTQITQSQQINKSHESIKQNKQKSQQKKAQVIKQQQFYSTITEYKSSNAENYVQSSDRGQYQPPLLFEENEQKKQSEKSDSEDDEDQTDILQKLRAQVNNEDSD